MYDEGHVLKNLSGVLFSVDETTSTCYNTSKIASLEDGVLGEHEKAEPLFYYMKIDDLVPEDHLLRLIDRHVDFSFVRDKVKHLYSHTGRPSIDPEVLLRMLLIGYLYGVISERRLCEEVKMHLGYRWFVGFSLNDTVPDHSTFSHNRHDRFLESNLFQEIFDEIVRQCVSKGLVQGRHLTVDATHIKANASFRSMEPVVVEMAPKEYLQKLEEENPATEPWEPHDDYPHRGMKITNSTYRSKTDPDARLARKAPAAATTLSHSATYIMDNKSSIIVGADVGKPDKKADCSVALSRILGIPWRYGLRPKSVGADKGYGSAEFLKGLIDGGIAPYVPIIDYRRQNEKGIYSISLFVFDEELNHFICPEGKKLSYLGYDKNSKQQVYRASAKDCRVCQKKPFCTRDRSRTLSYHIYDAALKEARRLSTTKAYRIAQRMRKRVEELFGEAKEFMGLRKARFRLHRFVREQVLMTATAQNIKRMVKLLSKRGRGEEASSLFLGLNRTFGIPGCLLLSFSYQKTNWLPDAGRS